MIDATGAPQTVVVLGGTSDIARATVRALVRRRTRTVVLAGRRHEALEAEAADLRAGGVTVDVRTFDALDLGSHESFVASLFEDHDDVDLVLVAFGTTGVQARSERDRAAAVDVVETNYVGAVSVLVPIATRMRERGHGAIVVLSSVAGERPRRANFVYGSSKAGVDAFSQGLGDALRGSGVRVMVVRPGFVHTKMTVDHPPAPFSTTPERVADEIVRGLERGAHTIWVPPVVRWLMAVLRHLPRPLFRLIRR